MHVHAMARWRATVQAVLAWAQHGARHMLLGGLELAVPATRRRPMLLLLLVGGGLQLRLRRSKHCLAAAVVSS